MLTATDIPTDRHSYSYKQLLRGSGIQYLKIEDRGAPTPCIAAGEDGERRETLTNKDKMSNEAKQIWKQDKHNNQTGKKTEK